MLYTHLILLFLTMLTMCTIGRSTMHISCGLLIPITLVYRNVINILLISILTLNNIIIINMLIFIQCLLLSAVMGIIYFISNFGVCGVHIHLIRRLNHINSILMIWNVMTLEMIFFFQDIHVFICGHYISMRHTIIQVLFIIASILLSTFKYVLYLRFQFLLFLYLFLLLHFFLSLLLL